MQDLLPGTAFQITFVASPHLQPSEDIWKRFYSLKFLTLPRTFNIVMSAGHLCKWTQNRRWWWWWWYLLTNLVTDERTDGRTDYPRIACDCQSSLVEALEDWSWNRVLVSVVNYWRRHAVSWQDDVISVNDLDKVMSDGLGMRYAFMGPFETCHLNAEGMADC